MADKSLRLSKTSYQQLEYLARLNMRTLKAQAALIIQTAYMAIDELPRPEGGERVPVTYRPGREES